MLKLRISQPGQKDILYEVETDEAVLGRASNCDVVIQQSYVSKRHAKILAGIVVADLGSSNGTLVDGRRIEEAVLLTENSFQLGCESPDVRVEVEHERPDAPSSSQLESAREDLDAERRRSASLAAEVDTLREAAQGAVSDPESLPVVRDLRKEVEDLRTRIGALKAEVEERDVSASEGLQARLAGDALSDVQRHNEELRQRVAELEASVAAPALEAAKKALAERVAELEADHAEDRETIRRLDSELEAAKATSQSPASASDLFFKLQAENLKLRQELEAGQKEPAGGSPELFFGLQNENRTLKKRIEELEAGAPSAAVPDAPDAPAAADDEVDELRRQVHELRMSKVDLTAELEQLRAKAQAATGAAIPAAHHAVSSGNVADLLRSLVADDVDDRAPMFDGGAEPFLVLELFRFLRQVERVVTRMAGSFIQLFDQRTMLPDMEGNVRGLIDEVVATANERKPREDLIAYIEELRKWLVVALGANRRAAERFVEEIKSDLSLRSLTSDDPIPAYKKLTGQGDAELWQRASAYLKKLTSDVVEDRLEKLCRACAEEIRSEHER